MTAIVALASGWIGGDSSVEVGNELAICSPDPKVWRPRPGLLVGAAGSIPWCGAVAWVDWPVALTDEWLRRSLPRALESAEPSDSDEAVIRTPGGFLYAVEAKGAYRVRGGYYAIGSGAHVALGALSATGRLGGKLRCKRALEAAARHVPSVAPPFVVLRA